MPLFMDFHLEKGISVEEVKKAHIADEAVQSKYGVIYRQFWVNEEEGTIFCLMEGPDKESCEAVHREAHGNIACSIVEVAGGFYKMFMGEHHFIENGHVKYPDGSPDVAIRNILVTNVQGVTTIKKTADYSSIQPPFRAKDLLLSILLQNKGREVNWQHDDSLVAVFDSSADAVRCALGIQTALMAKKNSIENDPWNIIFRMGLSAGQPLTEKGELFAEATILARRLCSVAAANELLISSKIPEYCNAEELIRSSSGALRVRLLSKREEAFISSLYAISEEKLADEDFTVDSLSQNIGISRPQLYRKVISLTGKSPNDFIRELRMDKALALIRKKAGNISEIALEVGYNNPSYFAKCFQLRYGCSPSRFVA